MAEQNQTNPVYYTIILSALTGVLAYVVYVPPLSSARPKEQSNPIIDLNQRLTVRIKKSANPSIDFSRVTDMWLGLDYTATF
jgi:hypothetical protein